MSDSAEKWHADTVSGRERILRAVGSVLADNGMTPGTGFAVAELLEALTIVHDSRWPIGDLVTLLEDSLARLKEDAR